MKWVLSFWSEPSTDDFRAAGSWLLTSALIIGLAFTLLWAWLGTSVALVWPLVLLVLVSGAALFRYPLANLAVVIAAFAIVAAHEEGFQVTEVLYHLYFGAFVAVWTIANIFDERPSVLRDPEDKAMAVFIGGVTLMIPVSLLFGAKPSAVVSEYMALLMLLMYFPVKEACVRYRKGPTVVVSAFLGLGLFAVIRNLLLYKASLTDAAQAWEIATGRVVMNDILLMVVSLMALVFLTGSRSWKGRIVSAGLFAVFLAGLVLTQSRGYWVAFLFGCFVMLLFVNRMERRRLILFSVGGFAALGAAGLLLFPDYFELIFFGLAGRFVSLATATTEDISLVNRFRETVAVLSEIVRNPLLGYGMGVPYTFYDIVHQGTDQDSFVHNGYIGLWFKFGIWGLCLVLFLWIRSAWKALHIRRKDHGLDTLIALGGAVALSAITVSAITSNPFFLRDHTLVFAVLTGLAVGVRQRLEAPTSVES